MIDLLAQRAERFSRGVRYVSLALRQAMKDASVSVELSASSWMGARTGAHRLEPYILMPILMK